MKPVNTNKASKRGEDRGGLDKKIDEMLTWDIDGVKEPAIFAPEMKKAITKLITSEIIAELERLEFTVIKTGEALGEGDHTIKLETLKQYVNLRKVQLKAKETQL